MSELESYTHQLDIPRSHPHPGWILTAAIESSRTLIWALIPLLISVRDRGAIVMAATTALFAIGVVVWRAIQWRHIWYSAESGSITVETGILDKSRKSVRPERVQSVDSIETPISRLIGISELRISTASAGEALTIPAISVEDADRLRMWISTHKSEAAAQDAPVPGAEELPPIVEPVLIRRMSGHEVVLAGMTSGRIAPAVAIVALAFRFATDILPDSIWGRVPIDPDRLTAGSIAFVIAAGAVLVWGLSVLGAVLTLWDFTLQRTPESIIVTSGLLDRRQNTIGIRRVQGISIVDGPLRQPIGFASIVIESAAPQQFTDESGEVRHLFPFLPRSDAPGLIELAIPEFGWVANKRQWMRLPSRARRRYLMPVLRDFGFLTIVACLTLWRLDIGEWWYGLAFLAFVPVMLILTTMQFRDAGWSHEPGNRLVLQTRSIDRTTTFLQAHRIQIRELSQNWLQRRADLGTLSLFTSIRGGRGQITIRHTDYGASLRLLEALGPDSQLTLPATAEPPGDPQFERSPV